MHENTHPIDRYSNRCYMCFDVQIKRIYLVVPMPSRTVRSRAELLAPKLELEVAHATSSRASSAVKHFASSQRNTSQSHTRHARLQTHHTTMSTDPRARRRAQPPPPPPPPEAEPDMTTMGLDGTNDRPPSTTANGQPPNIPTHTKPSEESFKLKFCTVCASNNNR